MSRTVSGAITGFARFLYHFLVGDDWVVALVMVAGLAATAGLVAARIQAWWLVPVLAVVMTEVSLRRRARRA